MNNSTRDLSDIILKKFSALLYWSARKMDYSFQFQIKLRDGGYLFLKYAISTMCFPREKTAASLLKISIDGCKKLIEKKEVNF